MGLTGNQLTKDAWLPGSSPIFNVRKLMENGMHITGFFGLKYLPHLENFGEKNTLLIQIFHILR